MCEGCGTKLQLEQIEDIAITIANSEYMRCLKRARSWFLRFLLSDSRPRSLVVGGNHGSRAVIFPIPRVGLLEERLAVSGRREKTQREELQCQMEDATAEGLVVKTVTNKIFTSLDRCDDHVTTGLCPYRVIDRGKSKLRMETSRAHVLMERHPGIPSGLCLHGKRNRRWRVVDVRIMEWPVVENAKRCVNVGKLVNETITSNLQALMVVESENTLTGDLRSVGGRAACQKSPLMSASIANALIEKSVREMQSTSSMVYGTMSNPGSAS